MVFAPGGHRVNVNPAERATPALESSGGLTRAFEWAHMADPPRGVRWLQTHGVILGPEARDGATPRQTEPST